MWLCVNTAEAVLVVFKVYVPILIHYWRFGGLGPDFDKLPVALEEDSSEDVHVMPEQSPSLPAVSAPPDQQLGGVPPPLPPVQRHQQGTLCSRKRTVWQHVN